MLSDCTGMVGGETALRTGDGEIVKVRGPQKVRLPCEKTRGNTNTVSRGVP